MLERFVDRLGLTDLTLMVQDGGGRIGLGLGGRRRELVHRLIIGNPWAWPHDREPRIRAFSWVIGGPIGQVLTRRFNFVPRVFFARGFAQPIDPRVLELYFAPWSDPDGRTPTVIAPRQLVAASPYLAEIEAFDREPPA